MARVSDYTAILSGNYWSGEGASNAPAFVTYSFETVRQNYIPTSGVNQAALDSFRVLSNAEKTAAREALEQWADASGLVFLEVGAGKGDIRFGAYDFALDPNFKNTAGYAFFPQTQVADDYSYRSDIGGDIFLDYGYASEAHTLLHEIGHAIGFKHPFEGDPTLTTGSDSTTNTIMSYTGPRTSSLGPFDISAVRAIYGGAGADGAGLASWDWNAAAEVLRRTGQSSANVIYGVAVKDVIAGGGGNDLVLGFEGNDVLKGGSGNDRIYGGTGRDTLRGDAGADIMLGDEGNDRFEFTSVATGGDTIRWFGDEAGDNDVLAFSARAFGSLGRSADGTGALLAKYFQSGSSNVAQTADVRFIYDAWAGDLYFDADGAGGKAAKLLLSLNNFASLSAADFVIF